MSRPRLPGSSTRRALGWLFGEEPVGRFVDPVLADMQAEWTAARGQRRWARTRTRLLGAAHVARALPCLLVRSEAESALGWVVAPLLALALGLVALVRVPHVFGPQLEWLAIGLVAAFGARGVGRRAPRVPAWLAAVLGTLAVVPLFAAGSWFVRLPATGIVTVWAELARPALLLAVAVVLGQRRSTGRALAALGLCAAWTAAAVAFEQPLHAIVVGGAVASAFAAERSRRARLMAAACVLAAVVATAVAVPPWGWHPVPAEDTNQHTDFVLVLLASRAGALAAVAGVLAVLACAWWPWRVMRRATARLASPPATVGVARTYAVVLGTSLTLQVLAHLGTLAGITPCPGAALPLVGYGGSSLVGALVSLGLAAGLAASSSDRRLAAS